MDRAQALLRLERPRSKLAEHASRLHGVHCRDLRQPHLGVFAAVAGQVESRARCWPSPVSRCSGSRLRVSLTSCRLCIQVPDLPAPQPARTQGAWQCMVAMLGSSDAGRCLHTTDLGRAMFGRFSNSWAEVNAECNGLAGTHGKGSSIEVQERVRLPSADSPRFGGASRSARRWRRSGSWAASAIVTDGSVAAQRTLRKV